MADANKAQDPLEFVRGMWNNLGFALPGMVTPTLDVGELDKRIADLKAVENWLKMNLSLLQITTQGLEMQRAAIAAVQAMGQQARESGAPKGSEASANPFASAAMWPWNLMGAQGAGAPQESAPSKAPSQESAAPSPKAETGKR